MKHQDYDEYITQFIKQLEIIRANAHKIQKEKGDKQRARNSERSPPFTFKVGDIVMRYIGDKQVGNEKKLKSNYLGPYEVISILPNNVNYIIQNIHDQKETITVHGSKLAHYDKKVIKNKNEPKKDNHQNQITISKSNKSE